MNQDVQQWLTEIQSLQRRLAHVSQDRAAAYEQISRWQNSYQMEAQQRRKDIRRLQTVIYRLDRENKRLKQQLDLPSEARTPFFMVSKQAKSNPENGQDDTPTAHVPGAQGDNKQQTAQINQKLQATIVECDRLVKALSKERAEHEQTRQTLMMALGDTVEQLERERQRHSFLQSSPKPHDGQPRH